jgi:hypothetical protein
MNSSCINFSKVLNFGKVDSKQETEINTTEKFSIVK